jgi:hypothetical protein
MILKIFNYFRRLVSVICSLTTEPRYRCSAESRNSNYFLHEQNRILEASTEFCASFEEFIAQKSGAYIFSQNTGVFYSPIDQKSPSSSSSIFFNSKHLDAALKDKHFNAKAFFSHPIQHLNPNTLPVCLTSSNYAHFYHFICDLLPMLVLLKKYSEHHNISIQLFLNSTLKTKAFAVDVLKCLDLDPIYASSPYITLDNPLIVKTLTNTGQYDKLKHTLMADFLRSFSIEDHNYTSEILILSRQGYDGDLSYIYYHNLLQDFSNRDILFIQPDHFTIIDQFKFLYNSRIIIAAHGGSLACIAGCDNKTIIEISTGSWYNDCFTYISIAANNWHYIIQESHPLPKLLSVRKNIYYKQAIYDEIKRLVIRHL